MRPDFPFGLWLLRRLLLTTKLNIQMSVLPLLLIHFNRDLYMSCLTGIKRVIYLHAVMHTHLQDQALKAHRGFCWPTCC